MTLTSTPKVCGIPEHEVVFSGIALGYADESAEVNELRSERVLGMAILINRRPRNTPNTPKHPATSRNHH
jgi:hypothetical protein